MSVTVFINSRKFSVITNVIFHSNKKKLQAFKGKQACLLNLSFCGNNNDNTFTIATFAFKI